MDSSVTSPTNHNHHTTATHSSSEHHRHGSRSTAPPRPTFKSVYSFPSPRSGTFINGKFHEQQPHFLDSCFLCKKPLGCNRDIFMYRGDIPFCTEECRAEQIDIDEVREKKRNLSASIKALRKKEETEKSSSNSSSPNYTFHSGAVAAA